MKLEKEETSRRKKREKQKTKAFNDGKEEEMLLKNV